MLNTFYEMFILLKCIYVIKLLIYSNNTMSLLLTLIFIKDIHEASLMTYDETLSYVNDSVQARKNGR